MAKVSRTPKSKSGPPPAKPSETTKRRKAKICLNDEGETPEEFVARCGSGISDKMFESITKNARITALDFAKNVDKTVRMRIPIPDNKRIKIEGEDFFPAQYVKVEAGEFVIVQAPTKANHNCIWKCVWKDQIRIIISCCHQDEMGDKDDKKCFTYFLTEVGQTKEVQTPRSKLLLVCKTKEVLSCGVIKYEYEMADVRSQPLSAAEKALKDDDPLGQSDDKLLITFFHVNRWTGKFEKDGFDGAQDIALAAKQVFKADMNSLLRSKGDYVSPVMIQSFDGVGRAPIFTIILMLVRETEKRMSFDVPGHMSAFTRLRPGSFNHYYHFVLTFLVSLWVAKEGEWIAEPIFTENVENLMKGFKGRKLNEVGRII